jgi:hypothetical protein
VISAACGGTPVPSIYPRMEGGRERKRLWPMSGELQAMVDYERHDPAEDDRRRRHPKKPPPATGGAILLHGLARLAVILVPLGGVVTLLAWLYARHADKPVPDVLPIAFYIGAAAVGVFAVLGGTSGGRNIWASGGSGYDRAQRAAAVNTSAVLACLAIILFALGFLLDYVL